MCGTLRAKQSSFESPRFYLHYIKLKKKYFSNTSFIEKMRYIFLFPTGKDVFINEKATLVFIEIRVN